jgi:transketolase
MRDRFVRTLHACAETDPRLILVTGDLGFGVLTEYAEKLPAQFLNAGVAEQSMTALATGLALEGHVAFTYSIANFPTLRCLEQIRNDAAYHDANVNVVSIGGGFSYGALGMSHHATEDLAIMRAIPQVTVVSPGCLWETEQATRALIETPGTGYLRLDKSHAGETGRKGERFELGKPRLLRDGAEVTVLTTGGVLGEVLEAEAALRDAGIGCDVFSCHTLKPFEAERVLTSARKTGRVVCIEEHIVTGGLSGLTAETLLEAGVSLQWFKRIGITGGFCSEVGSQPYLRRRYGLDAASIVSAVRGWV